jgi:hypothetical protein
MIYIGVFIALVLFIYINRSIQKRRDLRRETMRERKEEYLRRLLEHRKKADGSTKDEVSSGKSE